MVDPIHNPGFYSDPEIGGRPLPGKLIDVRGLKSVEEWTTVRPIAGTGWTQTHKGRLPIKGIEIEVSLNAKDDAGVAAAYLEHYAYVMFLRGGKPPPVYSKPPAFVVTYTPFRDVGIQKLVYAGHTAAMFTVGKNIVIYTFDEATKAKLIPIGPPEAAILNETNPNPVTVQGEALVAMVTATRGAQDPREPAVTKSDIEAQYGAGK